jgi:colicin import membrane protein
MHTVDEPGRVASGILALLVHLLFFGMLVIGISWQKKIVGPVMVDLWEELPEPVKKVSPPSPKIVETPPKPAPEVRKEPLPPPPPKVEAPPKPSPAEIELREKVRKQKDEDEAKRLEEKKALEAEKRRLEDERRAEEEAKRLEQEKLKREEEARRQEEQNRLEEQRRAEEGRRLEEEAKRQEQERLEREEERRERAAAVERERQQQEAQRKQREADEAKRRAEAAAREKQQMLINDYMARIQAKVKPRIVMPQDLKGRPEGVYEVTLLPGGDILEIQLKRSSGAPAYDAAVERAINLSSPLPVPDDSDLFQQYFRKFNFTFKPPP